MYISKEDKDLIIRELITELDARYDGSRRNLLVPVCPTCGKGGSKMGIYVGPDTKNKHTFMSHCFKCGATTTTLNQLLSLIGRPDLAIEETASFEPVKIPGECPLEDEIDDDLVVIDMPQGWKRCFTNPYLSKRGFEYEDYEHFPVGTTRGLNFKFDDYVLFPVIDAGDIVGYVGRHTWSKDDIDSYNERARWAGKYEIRRYNNSRDNDFVKLIYNYDSIIEDETDTVIVCEGIFDVIALTRKLNLYDNHRIVAVATFGKKFSEAQVYKIQSKGVRTVVLAYDSDARQATISTANMLNEYFDCYIANLQGDGKDFDEMSFREIYDTFAYNLFTPREYKLRTV